ncbi:MAG TPA: hypothetical protein VM677_27950 [Actinokineospora sp.]|jgi:hypothetical protein|nr:hypothetical protein [Actinokineospora sp.]
MTSTGTGSRIVAAIEAAWTVIRECNPDVPEVVVVTGSGFAQRGGDRWAHFWAERWTVDTETEAPRVPELFVAGELLGLPGARIMQTLLHEAAHGLARIRGIQDTNVNGRHNLKFVELATELGDEWPDGKTPHKTHGFSAVEITEAAKVNYATVIAELETARLAHLRDITIAATGGAGGTGDDGDDDGETIKRGRGSRGGRTGSKRPNAVCACVTPDPFPISPGRLARRPILCGDCGSEFRHPEDSALAA